MIEINNLNVLYNNSIRALDNVSIKIEQQKCIAIVGENGSGKSTLLSSLLGLVETQGEIKINGVMLSKETLIQIREVAGLVFQNPDHMIFLPTVRDNLAFGLINQKLDKIEIDKKKIVMDTIKLAGGYDIEIKLYPEVSTKMKVVIVPQE